MLVEELIELLSRVPKGNIITVDTGQEEDEEGEMEIVDVLIGYGTLKGFSYLKIRFVD